MAEIASDSEMSAANLYRFFINKQDIAHAVASRCIAARLTFLRSVVKGSSASVAGKLREFAVCGLRYTHRQALEQCKIVELVSTLSRDCPGLVDHRMTAECSLIAELLSEGIRRDEFAERDVPMTAGAILCVLHQFNERR